MAKHTKLTKQVLGRMGVMSYRLHHCFILPSQHGDPGAWGSP